MGAGRPVFADPVAEDSEKQYYYCQYTNLHRTSLQKRTEKGGKTPQYELRLVNAYSYLVKLGLQQPGLPVPEHIVYGLPPECCWKTPTSNESYDS